MASKKFEKGSEEWQLFKDFYILCQELWEPEQTDGYWEDVKKQADVFYKKYNTSFAKALAVALVEDLDRRCRLK